MERSEIIAGNKLIAEFMGYDTSGRTAIDEVVVKGNIIGHLKSCRISQMGYYESWDWQIPVYSKVVSVSRERLVIKGEDAIRDFFTLKGGYEKAVSKNDCESGFTHLVMMVTLYNSLPSQPQK